MSDTPTLIVVTGAPATGKSTVAMTLAERLRVPFIVKDTLKETLYDTFGYGGSLEPKIERAALELLFTVADAQLKAGVSVVAESNFDARFDTAPIRRLCRERDIGVVQIHCHARTDAVIRHFVERAASGTRHPGHEDEPEKAEEVREKLEAGLWDALDLPGVLIELPVLEREVDYDALVDQIERTAAA